MDQIHLDRFAYSPHGTFGILNYHEFNCFTVERPWLDNVPSKSCIPIGAYRLEPRRYNRGGYETYEIVGVPNRSLILIHIANTMDDVEGCIGLGKALSFIKQKWAVSSSRHAFNEWWDLCEDIPPQRMLITNVGGGEL